MRRAKTETIIQAMRILAEEIQSDDGVANAAISEAADRLEELRAAAEKRCVWTPDTDYGETYDGACGVKWILLEGSLKDNGMKFCPRCGGRVTQINTDKGRKAWADVPNASGWVDEQRGE